MPRKYGSEGRLLIKVGRESITLDPTATTSQTMVMQKSEEEEINTALEVIQSHRIKELVVEKLGVEPVLEGELPGVGLSMGEKESSLKRFAEGISVTVDSVADWLLEIGVRDPVSERERALLKLDDTLLFWASKKSRVISIYSESRTPEMAQAIAKTAIEAFIDEHITISQTKGSYDFFKVEVGKTAEDLELAKLEMAKFMSENQIVSVEHNQVLLANSWDKIFDNIIRLESQEKELASQYSEAHPRRAALIEELAAARQVFERLQEQPEIVDSILANSDIEGQDQESTDIGSFTISEPVQMEEYADMASRIESLLLSNNDLENYQERVQSLETKLALHRQKLEEARLIKEQKASSISNITIFQEANLNRKPVAPNKPLIALGTIFLGFCFSGSLALLREFLIRRKYLRNESDVERTLNLPVLAKLSPDRSATIALKKRSGLQKMRTECSDIVHRFVHFFQDESNDQGIVIGVFGIEEGTGASTVAAALATCCSIDFGIKTILVDADRKRQSVRRRFSLNGAPGLHELALENTTFEDCLQHSQLFNLDLISSTSKSRFEKDLGVLSISNVMTRLNELKKQFELVIVDLPSATAADSLVALAPLMDHVLLVGEPGSIEIEKAKNITRKFQTSDSQLLGVILNKCQRGV